MYKQLVTQYMVAATAATSTLAGSVSEEVAPTPSKSSWLKPSLELRLRYETKNVQDSDFSHALTARVRPGLELFPDSPLSAFIQSEHTQALVGDYQVGTPQSAAFSPFKAGNSPITDPENNEINQAYLKYAKDGFSAKVGRQRLILDNAAFIGNVGWRQNEQTFDAATFSYKGENYELLYSYANQANRIFGVDGTGPVQALEGDVHLFNAKLQSGDNSYGAYAYLMDFSDQAAGFPVAASNNTYGVQADLKTSAGQIHTELAFQTEAGSKADYDALYGAFSYTQKVGKLSLTGGVEYLGDDFVTPLATVHAFNGFADAFIGNRLGLANSWEGLTDIYAVASTKLDSGYVLKGYLHYFANDSLSTTYGWEADLLIVKPINKNTTVLAKFSYFKGKDSGVFFNDILQASIQLDYKF